METWLGLARAFHYAAATGLFGLCLFRQYAPALAWSRGWALGLCLMGLASGVAWFVLVTANLAGGVQPNDLMAVGLQTAFGLVWAARMAIGLVLVALAALAKPPTRIMTLISALFLITIGLTGHTQIHDDWRSELHVISDVLHLAGAGIWLGGLIGLARLLREVQDSGEIAASVRRFSAMAQFAVGMLVITGLINAMMVIGRYDQLLSSQYIRQLLVKLAFVAGMLVLAMVNRFRLSPRLEGPSARPAVKALRRNVLIEQGLGALVLLSVGWLGMCDPPV